MEFGAEQMFKGQPRASWRFADYHPVILLRCPVPSGDSVRSASFLRRAQRLLSPTETLPMAHFGRDARTYAVGTNLTRPRVRPSLFQPDATAAERRGTEPPHRSHIRADADLNLWQLELDTFPPRGSNCAGSSSRRLDAPSSPSPPPLPP